jgi:hypothetical protein
MGIGKREDVGCEGSWSMEHREIKRAALRQAQGKQGDSKRCGEEVRGNR